MLRTRDRMKELFVQSEKGVLAESEREWLMGQVDRVEKQGVLLLSGLRAIYVALGAFAGATLVTLLGAALFSLQEALWFRLLAALGLVLGFVGVMFCKRRSGKRISWRRCRMRMEGSIFLFIRAIANMSSTSLPSTAIRRSFSRRQPRRRRRP